MMWDDSTGRGMHNGGWWFGLVLLFALIALVAAAVMWVTYSEPTSRRNPDGAGPPFTDDPAQILRLRFAAGEIDDDEFLRRLSVLESGPPH